MRQDERWRAVHRMPAAPAARDFVRSTPEDEGAAFGEHAVDFVAVDAGFGTEQRMAVLLGPGEIPVENVLTAVHTERVRLAVIRASDETIQGHRHVDHDFAHGDS